MASSSGAPRAAATAAPIDVVVSWCGISHLVQVQPNATVQELKRNISTITGLPSKRQKHRDTVHDAELNDDVLISSLQPNHSTKLIGLKKNDQTYRTLFFGRKAECSVIDDKKALLDFDESKMGLSTGTYQVGILSLSCLIKKIDDRTNPVILSSYKLLRTFRHPTAIAMENIYKSGPLLRLVFLSSCVDGTFNGWIQKNGTDRMINLEDGTFTSLFRKLIIELCDVLDNLIKIGVCPKDLTKENLYLKMVNGEARLKVLFNNVEPLQDEGTHQLNMLCHDMRSIIVDGFMDLNRETKFFCDFLGKQGGAYLGKNLAKVLNSYPDTWTYENKGSYLIDVMSSAQNFHINESAVAWPKDETGDDMCNELKYLKQMMKDGANEKFKFEWNYDVAYPRDFVRLGRNLWKHFHTIPEHIQSFCGGNREGLLHKLEEWCPDLWFLMYDAVGPV